MVTPELSRINHFLSSVNCYNNSNSFKADWLLSLLTEYRPAMLARSSTHTLNWIPSLSEIYPVLALMGWICKGQENATGWKLWVPWVVPSWHKRAGVATVRKYFITLWISRPLRAQPGFIFRLQTETNTSNLVMLSFPLTDWYWLHVGNISDKSTKDDRKVFFSVYKEVIFNICSPVLK